MGKIIIEASKDKPKIVIDPVENKILIEGASYPENAVPTYVVIINWLEQNVDLFSKPLLCDFYFTYINSASKKSVFEILVVLSKVKEAGNEVNIIWRYDRSDEDMYDMGCEFLEMAKLESKFVPVDPE